MVEWWWLLVVGYASVSATMFFWIVDVGPVHWREGAWRWVLAGTFLWPIFVFGWLSDHGG